MEWKERSGVQWLEAELPGATAAFSTRIGGTSGGDFKSLNVGILTEDDPGNVIANRERLAQMLGAEPENVLMGHQVHGAELARHEEPQRPSPFAEGVPASEQVDAQVTTTPGLVPLVQVADCLPIALAGNRGVAMVHGGWRGLAAGIAEKAAAEVGATAAAIGPGIGACCYEVGEEVIAAFPELKGGQTPALRGQTPLQRGQTPSQNVHTHQTIDLAEIADRRLRAAGVEHVQSAGLCTSCNPELFFSHRRDSGHTGRQAGLVWID